MKFMEEVAIFLAKNSVTRFQERRLVRGICRASYKKLADLYCIFSPQFIKKQNLAGKGEIVDTYPWPFCTDWFADWEESSKKECYSLVADHAGFVVKHSTSYCAWKISELTGFWPVRPRYMVDCSAAHWHRLLFHNNYRHTVKRPEPGRHYVGIMPSHYEYGEVVWFEGFKDGFSYDKENDTGSFIIFSTYRDKKFFIGAAPAAWYIWVEISTKN